jgi:mRNA-degrading endonuclease toxin of MazEF toxin-antitoxin module
LAENYELLRGTVWEVDLPDVGLKPAVIVSYNGRNRSKFDYVHMVRISTAPPKRDFPTIIPLSAADHLSGLTGAVRCDDLTPVSKDLIRRRLGALSPDTMRRVGEGLSIVLALD